MIIELQDYPFPFREIVTGGGQPSFEVPLLSHGRGQQFPVT
jgi:hypothetical protein